MNGDYNSFIINNESNTLDETNKFKYKNNNQMLNNYSNIIYQINTNGMNWYLFHINLITN